MVYLPSESSYFRSKMAELNPWLALDLGHVWIIKSVSVVRLTDSLAAINKLFQVISSLVIITISTQRLWHSLCGIDHFEHLLYFYTLT